MNTDNIPTPFTDQLLTIEHCIGGIKHWWVKKDEARRLERQNAQLSQRVADLVASLTQSRAERDHCHEKANELQDDFRLNDALAKLREAEAQIVALREALMVVLSNSEGSGPFWHAGEIMVGVRAALSMPPAPCVPLAEHQKVKEAFDAARAFIDSHAADPDLTAEMCQTYAVYQDKIKALPAAEEDPYQSEDYQRFVAKTAENCTADDAPCDACLAGGYCDGPSDFDDIRDEHDAHHVAELESLADESTATPATDAPHTSP